MRRFLTAGTKNLPAGGYKRKRWAFARNSANSETEPTLPPESRLFGVDMQKRDLTASAQLLEALTPGFVAGDYRAAPIAETCALNEAQEAYRKVAAGATGRIGLRPQE